MSRRDQYSDDSYDGQSYDQSQYTESQYTGDDYTNDDDGDDYTNDESRTYNSRQSYSTRGTEQFPASTSYRDNQEDYSDEEDYGEDGDEMYDDEEYHDEYDENYYNHDDGAGGYEYRNDEAEEERALRKQRKRDDRDSSLGKKVVAAICCLCICLITILVLILVLIVFKKDDTEMNENGGIPGMNNGPTTPKPTPRPTYPVPPALKPANMGRPDIFTPWIRTTDAPTISPYPTSVASSNPTKDPTKLPTPRPTISPAPTRKVPPTLTLPAVADTYIYVDGFFQYEAWGKENSFLVQNGMEEFYEFADALGLIAFDLSEMPRPNQLASRTPTAILKLTHLDVNKKFLDRESSVINVRRLVSTPMRIETIHGGMYNKEPAGSILGKNSFTVGVTQRSVQVDITDLLFPDDFQDTGYDKDQLFIMLINNGVEQGDAELTKYEAGDRFVSTDANDGTGPRLTITF